MAHNWQIPVLRADRNNKTEDEESNRISNLLSLLRFSGNNEVGRDCGIWKVQV